MTRLPAGSGGRLRPSPPRTTDSRLNFIPKITTSVRHSWEGPPFFVYRSRGQRIVHIAVALIEEVGVVENLRRIDPELYRDAVDADYMLVGTLCGQGVNYFRFTDCEDEGDFCDDCLLVNIRPVVYRVFDILDRLLYVGCTTDPFRRLAEHRLHALWWHLAADWTVEQHPDLETALRAEKTAIASERPWFNRRGITAPSVTSEA